MARLEGHKSSGDPIWDEWMRIMDEERANKSDSSKDGIRLSGESSDSNTSVIQDASNSKKSNYERKNRLINVKKPRLFKPNETPPK